MKIQSALAGRPQVNIQVPEVQHSTFTGLPTGVPTGNGIRIEFNPGTQPKILKEYGGREIGGFWTKDEKGNFYEKYIGSSSGGWVDGQGTLGSLRFYPTEGLPSRDNTARSFTYTPSKIINSQKITTLAR